MYQDIIENRWDFYLAHAGADSKIAADLYETLSLNARVFLDERNMKPGDPWSLILPKVLRQSRIIVVLVSSHTRKAWYEDSEIRIAIDLVRDYPDCYRVIALLLDEEASIRRSDLPYGLEQTVTLSFTKCGSLENVVQRLLDTLSQDEGSPSEVESDSISLVDAVTAFVGETEKGPVHPILLTSWDDFKHYFGYTTDLERTFLPLAVRGFFQNGGERAYVARVTHNATRAEVSVATNDMEQRLNFAARSTGVHGNRILVRIRQGSRIGVRITIETTPEIGMASHVPGEALGSQAIVEDYDNLSLGGVGPNPLLAIVNSRSELVSVEWDQPSENGAAPETGEWALVGGTDGWSTVEDYIGTTEVPAENRNGLAAVALLDDVAIVCVPDATHPRFSLNDQEALTATIIEHCERHKCFGVLSTRSDQVGDTIPTAPSDTSSAAIYFPWIGVPGLEEGGDSVLIPPVGHIAGAYARLDRKAGVHKQPIGIVLNGLVSSTKDQQLVCTLVSSQIDEFVRRGVNVLMHEPAPSQRVVLGSAVTLAIDMVWQPISVRRFFNFVERAVIAGTAWVVFAPNNEETWAEITSEIDGFLTRLWRAGVLAGNKPEEAFFVRCDRSTMTESDIANGRVSWLMGVSLADENLIFPMITTANALNI